MSSTLHYTQSRLRRFADRAAHLPRTIGLVRAAAGHLTTLWAALLVAQGLLPLATVYLTRALVNSLVATIRSAGNWHLMRSTLLLAFAMGVVWLATVLLRSAATWARTAQSELVKDYLANLIQQKSVAVDLAFYDSSDFYDHLHRARAEAIYRPLALLENLGGLLQNGITVVAMVGVLLPFGPVLPLALFIGTLPALYVVLRNAERHHRWAQQATVEERRSWYYDHLLTDGEPAPEMRLFGLGDYFRNGYRDLRQRLRAEKVSLARQQALGELFGGMVALLTVGAAMGWMLWRALRGQVSLGDLALFYQAFNQGLGLSRTLLENVGHLYENSLFLGNLFEFLDLKPAVLDPAQPQGLAPRLRQGIRFDHVTFRYPLTERVALQDFNLAIAPGQLVALVGPNGAGKSTLIKLLCRFYDPEQGQVLLDGVPLRELSLEHLRQRIAVLFQSPVRFNASAAANVAYGDVASLDGAGDLRIAPTEKVIRAAHAAGAAPIVAKLPNGYDTQLGRWFTDGTELSVGEWQRLGLARALLREADILVLDEPTSAMDPWAEIEWAQRVRAELQGRIGIIITHRFTTAMFADVIHVMSAGQVVESGTHEHLLAAAGLYAQGWAAQARTKLER